jgi:PRTRC genetic system protein B
MTPEFVQETNPTALLTKALLLWTSPDPKAVEHATLNDIVDGVIQPNTASITLAQLRALNTSLQELANEKAGKHGVAVFPPQLLYADPYQAVTAWWRASAPAPQFFDCEELGRIQGIVAMPSLVFLQRGTSLAVCAVAGRARPDTAAPVYHAPLFNTGSLGDVCLGEVALEPMGEFGAIHRNQDAFMRGINTHPNGLHSKTNYPTGIFALWRDLIADPTLGWDDQWLVPMQGRITLGQWLEKA